MKTQIETNQNFVFRLEDFIYIFLDVYLIPIGAFFYMILQLYKRQDSLIPFIIIVSVIGIAMPTILILLSYKKRLQDLYFIEDESIIRERNGKEIFRIPFNQIVSVRVNNKRGTQGTVIFFTDPRSKNFEFSFFNSAFNRYNTPIAAFGFTRKKIDLIKNRKQLITAIYLVNPDLHFID